MFIIGRFFIAIASVGDIVLNLYNLVILLRVILSWVNADMYNPIVQFVYALTEPVLARIRRMLPYMTLDFSPFIAFLIIVFLQKFLITSLAQLGYKLSLM